MNQEQAVHHTTLISGYHVSAASEHHRKNQENIIAFAFNRLQCVTILWNGSPVYILNVHRSYSFTRLLFYTNDVANITLTEQIKIRF